MSLVLDPFTSSFALLQLRPAEQSVNNRLAVLFVYHLDMNTLFDSKFNTDDQELEKLLTDPKVKNFLEGLWQKYFPYVLENSFRGDLKSQPHARIWEMYLANALIECGFQLVRKGERGPDIQLEEPLVWIEAVAATDPNKGNAKNIQSVSKTPEILLTESMWGGPPENEIILRWTNSIDEKRKKLNGYIAECLVSENEPYVIALNTHKVSFAQFDHQHTPNHIPMIVKAMFGYGGSVLRTFYPKDGSSPPISSDKFEYEYRPHIVKPTAVFI